MLHHGDLNLDVAVYIIGKVGKVKAQFELLIKPAAPVKVRSWSTREKLVFKLCPGVFQHEPQELQIRIIINI